MNKQVFCVYDSAAALYLDPFIAPTIEFALREFRDTVNREGHQFNRFPEDYTLFVIGEYSPEKGMIEATSPRSLGVAITFKEPSQHLQLLEEDKNA